ncbi:MAG: carboxypeptidase M32 [Treponema sp.]|jgi:carboxypeptidase Taq|nr:carboxypeptidase M32 [Treponema sp.]
MHIDDLHKIDRELCYLNNVAALLGWDQETQLPPKGVEDRSEQLALINSLAHERLVSKETGAALDALGFGEELPALERDFVRVMRRAYDREVKLPAVFVAEEARAAGLSQAAWQTARQNNDFAAFLPHLKTMLDLNRRKAEYWGFSGDRVYDGLLDSYEPDMSAADISAVFTPLRERLSALLRKIAAKPAPDVSFLDQDYPLDQQAAFNALLMDELGFDKTRGRLDISAHPFTTSIGADDVRITTRYFNKNLLSTIFSVIHETGHAFYEMSFPPELRGTSLADGASMAIHESQSRFWENVIGRGRPFWNRFYPMLQSRFPKQLNAVSLDLFYRAVNQVKPSLIRVDADEVSYSLHIILRFEIEKRLFAGTLEPEDLPAIWRGLMKEYLGVEPQTDADGVLQDVHWSMGSFGYFPSYAIGNLYGLQIHRRLLTEVPGFEALVADGRFDEIRTWLGKNVYTWGARLTPSELLMKITGEKLSVTPFLEYIEAKYMALYA